MKKSTREWVKKADADHRAAARLAGGSEPFHDQVYFHCQQSAEKYLKALLAELGLPIPKIHNLDRVCISQAAGAIKDEFNITNERFSYVLMAFTLAYGIFEIPTGHLGDRYGARKVLTRIVVCWSAFTMLTGACWGLWSLIVV